MEEARFAELTQWITSAGLAGQSETAMMTGFCERAVAAGLPLAGGIVIIDTLHPVYEGCAVFLGEVPSGGILPDRNSHPICKCSQRRTIQQCQMDLNTDS
jgi:hypothetical protein